MTRNGLKLDRDGKLAIPERNVQAACIDIARGQGYLYIPTAAEHLTRAGIPSHRRGTLDGVFIHQTQPPFFAEWKRRRARTKRQHLDEQMATSDALRKAGWIVYHQPEGHDDPIGDFLRWITMVVLPLNINPPKQLERLIAEAAR